MLNRTRLSSLDAFGLRDQRNRTYPALEASDGSTLSLDFTQMSSMATSGFTFERSSSTTPGGVGTATFINSSGYVQSVAADIPRFEYDPITLAPRGLLLEGSVANLLLYSQLAFTGSNPPTGWTSPFTGGPGSATTSTYGTLDGANAWTQTAASNRPMLSSTAIALTNGTTYTISMYLEAVSGGLTYQDVLLLNPSTATLGSPTYRRNGVTVSAGATAEIGRIEATVSCTGSGNANLRCGPGANANCTGSATFSRPQVEVATGSSSYIPTTTATVTRAADQLTMSNIALMQWNQTAGTFLWDMDVQAETNTSSFPTFAGMYRAGPVRVIRFQLNNSSRTNPRIGGGTWTSVPGALVADTFYTRPVGTAFKAAVAFANTGQSMTYCINGTVQTTVTGTGTLATPTLFLVHQDPSAADTEYFPIHLRRLKYWPTNLSSSDLRSITT